MSKSIETEIETEMETEEETLNLAPGELRDMADNYVCSFTGGVMFRDEEDEFDIGYLEILETESTPDLSELKIGMYKFVINGIVGFINIGDIDYLEGSLNAYYTSTGLDINLDKYRLSSEEDEECCSESWEDDVRPTEEWTETYDVYWGFNKDGQEYEMETTRVVTEKGDQVSVYVDREEYLDFVTDCLRLGDKLDGMLGNNIFNLLVREISLFNGVVQIRMEVIDFEERDYFIEESFRDMKAKTLTTMDDELIGKIKSSTIADYAKSDRMGGHLYVDSKESEIPNGKYKLLNGDAVLYIKITSSHTTMNDYGLFGSFTLVGTGYDGEAEEVEDQERIDPDAADSIHVTFQNIGIDEDTEMDPCSLTEIDGKEIWFANPKELSDSLEYCEDHTRELLDDDKAVSLNYLDEDRCNVLCELMQDLAEREEEDGFANIVLSPKREGE